MGHIGSALRAPDQNSGILAKLNFQRKANGASDGLFEWEGLKN